MEEMEGGRSAASGILQEALDKRAKYSIIDNEFMYSAIVPARQADAACREDQEITQGITGGMCL